MHSALWGLRAYLGLATRFEAECYASLRHRASSYTDCRRGGCGIIWPQVVSCTNQGSGEPLPMNVILLKYVHIVAVAASFALLFVRGLWVMRSYPSPQESWVRVLPHVVDAVLVGSAVALLFETQKLGWPGAWMTLKLAYVAAYVVLALVLLRSSKAIVLKILTWLAAVFLFLFITTVAVLRHPLGIFSLT